MPTLDLADYGLDHDGYLDFVRDAARIESKGHVVIVPGYGDWLRVAKFNRCHGPDGRFCSQPGGRGSITLAPPKKPRPGGGGGSGSGSETSAKPSGESRPTEQAKPKPTEQAKPAPVRPAEKGRDLSEAPPKELDAYHKEMSSEWRGKLKADEKNALGTYSSSVYGPLNEFNRTGKVASTKGWDSPEAKKTLQTLTKHADSAMAKASLKEPLTVFRGVKDLKAIGIDPKDIRAGTVVPDKALMSTSLTRKVADNFAGKEGAVLKIHAPKGAKGVSLDEIAVRHNAKEKEVLFARNSKLTVTGHSRDAKGRLVIEATISHE